MRDSLGFGRGKHSMNDDQPTNHREGRSQVSSGVSLDQPLSDTGQLGREAPEKSRHFWGPHPYWPNYFALWKAALSTPDVPPLTRLKQIQELASTVVLLPLCQALWTADRVLFAHTKEEISSPVFIIAQPRSATTRLHNALIDGATNGELYGVKLIEWHYPFLCLQKTAKLLGIEQLLDGLSFFPQNYAGGTANKMHQMSWGSLEEDGEFYQQLFIHPFVSTRFPYDHLRSEFTSESLPDDYQKKVVYWHREILQKVQHSRGPNASRYVGKEVLDPKWAEIWQRVYPDASFIFIDRLPEEFVGSFLQLNRQSTLAKTGIDVQASEEWREWTQQHLRNSADTLCRFFGNFDQEQKIVLNFDLVVKDFAATIAALYTRLGIEGEAERIEEEPRDNASITPIEGFDEARAFGQEIKVAHQRLIKSIQY